MIELRVLGSTELRREDGALEHSFLTGPKRLGLLAYLVLARPRGFHRRDALLPLFWPEHGQRAARNALSNMVYHIRRVLGNDVLTNRGTAEIGLEADSLWCDALAFEAALDDHEPEKAIELYRGELLKGFHVPGAAPEFGQWLDAERERLRVLATDAAWMLSDQSEQIGDWKAARTWAKKAAGFTPLSEEAHIRLIRLLQQSGDRTGALEIYEEYCTRLRQEWDLEPSEALTSVAKDISTQRSSPADSTTASKKPSLTRKPAMVESSDRPSIAVLPFANFSPDPEDEYLSDGITEELIHRLVKLRPLRVAARVSSFAFKDHDADIREIGHRLRVAYAVEGSVRKWGEQLRVTAQLIDVTTGYHLWSETYHRKMEDVFAIQDEIGRMIVEALQVELTDAIEPATDSARAYDLYLKGRYYFNKRTKADLETAIDLFERAIAQDSTFARAHAGLADTYLVLGSSSFGALSPQETLDRAQRAAEQALALDDTLADAHVSVGIVHMRKYDWQGTEEQFERAIDLDPGYAEAHQRYGWFLAIQGDFERGLRVMRRAEELDPLSLPIKTAIGRIYHFMHQPDDAIAQFRDTLDIEPNYDCAHIGLGLTLLYKERYSEAIACFEKASTAYMRIPPGIIAYAYALAGQHDRAQELLGEILKHADDEYVSPIFIGWIHMGLGETDAALDYFEKGYELSSPASTMKVEPLLDPLRSNRRFERLLQKVDLEETKSVTQDLPTRS